VKIASPLGALVVTRATVSDAPAVRALRDELARWMVQRGIRQWSPGEMPDEWIEVCIAFGSVYLVSHDDRLIGSVTIVWDDPLIWGKQPEPAGYIHMLMVDRDVAGHGIVRSILGVGRGFDRRNGSAPRATRLRARQPAVARATRTRLSVHRDQDVSRPRMGR
jgi:hypothetical protein